MSKFKQRPNESLKDYTSRCTSLYAELREATSKESTNRDIMNYLSAENEKITIRTFEDGLINQSLRVMARAKNEQNYNRLILYMKEEADRMGDEVSSNKTKNNSITCETCHKKGHSKETCYSRRNLPSFTQRLNSHKQGESSNIRCGYCNKPNHRRDECRTRLRDEELKRRPRSQNDNFIRYPRVNQSYLEYPNPSSRNQPQNHRYIEGQQHRNQSNQSSSSRNNGYRNISENQTRNNHPNYDYDNNRGIPASQIRCIVHNSARQMEAEEQEQGNEQARGTEITAPREN